MRSPQLAYDGAMRATSLRSTAPLLVAVGVGVAVASVGFADVAPRAWRAEADPPPPPGRCVQATVEKVGFRGPYRQVITPAVSLSVRHLEVTPSTARRTMSRWLHARLAALALCYPIDGTVDTPSLHKAHLSFVADTAGHLLHLVWRGQAPIDSACARNALEGEPPPQTSVTARVRAELDFVVTCVKHNCPPDKDRARTRFGATHPACE